MGWWEDLTNYAGELTGWNAANRQRDADEAAKEESRKREERMNKMLGGFTGDPAQMGAQAMAFAQQQAGQQANMQATEAARQSARAARTAGLNPGQAAVLGGQQTGSAWLQAQQAALNQGLQLYGNQQNANLAAAGMTPYQAPQYQNMNAGQQAGAFLSGAGKAASQGWTALTNPAAATTGGLGG